MALRKLVYGFHYVNKYNTKTVLEYIERLQESMLHGQILEVWSEEWTEGVDIIRYAAYGNKSLERASNMIFAGITMLLQLQVSGKVDKGA